jgi:hypothetical protein
MRGGIRVMEIVGGESKSDVALVLRTALEASVDPRHRVVAVPDMAGMTAHALREADVIDRNDERRHEALGRRHRGAIVPRYVEPTLRADHDRRRPPRPTLDRR